MSPLLDEGRLRSWLKANVPSAGDIDGIVRITSGGANELFELIRPDRSWVLRRPLLHPQDAAMANRTMAREYRLLRALADSAIPHPEPVAVCTDADVIGAAFYVMEKVDGVTTDGSLPSHLADAAGQTAFAFEAVDALAALHQLDWREAGLGDFGKPDGFLARQVGRWASHYERVQTRQVPGFAAVMDWLQANQPEAVAPTVIHGDFTPHNWMYSHSSPGQLVAVIDWEQATIGDPRMDLGHLLGGWADTGEPARFGSYIQPRDHLPARTELVQRYTAHGLEVTELAYFEVLAVFKLACVLEGNYKLFVSGRSVNPKHERAGQLVLDLMEQAADQIV